MRALVARTLGEPEDVLEPAEIPPPEPGPGLVRVRVGAAALNLPDVLTCRGAYILSPEPPFTPGLEVSGTVVALGPGVDPGLLGRRVVSAPELPDGGFAEECLFVAQRAYPVPDEMDHVDAAAMHIAFNSAHVALHRRAGLRPGETLLVHAGAGGVGSAAIQLGAVAGARVIATAGTPEKCRLCRDLGADEAIDYRSDDFAAAVRDLTGGRGADVVFDPVGGDVFDRSRRCVANEGRIVLVGFAGGRVQDVRASHVLMRNYTVMGLYMGAYAVDAAGRAFLYRVHAEVVDLRLQGRIHPVVGREITLEEVPGALADLGARRTTGKIVARL
ncbi:MAG TPA: NADPH:quinone oxidoreductase family protein [Acidimicrobiales bacterium]|nr:NADPH:quinone oxidoreductase family protein [Acidimicrobiales bacterium]